MKVVSKYTQVWNKIKTTGRCELVADPKFHKRIIKAVSRKKELDLKYQFQLAEQGRKERINTTIEGTKIIFILNKTSISIEDL